MTRATETEEQGGYQIGTVATLTGLDPHTIRAWERRYGAIKPARSESGRRRYDDHTVERLQLLKALVDCHEAIGTVARLPDETLRERLEKLADLGGSRLTGVDAERGGERWRIALMAPTLETQLTANAGALSEFERLVSEQDQETLLEAARQNPCEVVLVERDTLGQGAPGFVQACRNLPGSPMVVVLYRFAPRAALARLAQAGAKLVKTPIRLAQLRRTILDQLIIEQARVRKGVLESPPVARYKRPPASESAEAPARRFDDEQLARLFEVSGGIDCECPNHLSSLVSSLVAFEDYSRDCESRDEADAEQHRRLADGTAEARAQLENLLAELCEHEGIVV